MLWISVCRRRHARGTRRAVAGGLRRRRLGVCARKCMGLTCYTDRSRDLSAGRGLPEAQAEGDWLVFTFAWKRCNRWARTREQIMSGASSAAPSWGSALRLVHTRCRSAPGRPYLGLARVALHSGNICTALPWQHSGRTQQGGFGHSSTDVFGMWQCGSHDAQSSI